MELIKTVVANPHTLKKAYWHKVTDEEYKSIRESNSIVHFDPPYRGNINDKEHVLFKNGNSLTNGFYVEIK